jgi:hypothetical protein
MLPRRQFSSELGKYRRKAFGDWLARKDVVVGVKKRSLRAVICK